MHITTENDSETEQITAQMLADLLREHNLSTWTFTEGVHIAGGAQLHSHPTLTLNTRHIDDPDLLLATYIHEQLHWYTDSKREYVFAAMEALQALYPDAPVGLPEGGGPEPGDTYLHLVIGWLEYSALIHLIGQSRARDVMNFWCEDHFTWVYAQVMDDYEKIGGIIHKHELVI